MWCLALIRAGTAQAPLHKATLDHLCCTDFEELLAGNIDNIKSDSGCDMHQWLFVTVGATAGDSE